MKLFSKLSLLTVCSVCLWGCSQVEPFIDARREAGTIQPVGSSTKQYPVVCYGLFGNAAERQALAQSVCDESNTTAVLKETSYFECKLLTPLKETYQCKKENESLK